MYRLFDCSDLGLTATATNHIELWASQSTGYSRQQHKQQVASGMAVGSSLVDVRVFHHRTFAKSLITKPSLFHCHDLFCDFDHLLYKLYNQHMQQYTKGAKIQKKEKELNFSKRFYQDHKKSFFRVLMFLARFFLDRQNFYWISHNSFLFLFQTS